MTHTPGPWTMDRSADGRSYDYIRPPADPETRRAVAVARVVESARGRDEVEASGRLIEAAPDLLAAAEDALDVLTRLLGSDGEDPTAGLGDQSAVGKLRNAINRAKGGR